MKHGANTGGEPSAHPAPTGGCPTAAPSPAPADFPGYFPGFHKRAPARHRRGHSAVPRQPGPLPPAPQQPELGQHGGSGILSAGGKWLMFISQESSRQRLRGLGSGVLAHQDICCCRKEPLLPKKVIFGNSSLNTKRL